MAYLARRLAMSAVPDVADVEVFGHKLRIDPRGNLAEKRLLFTPQYFDPDERALLARALPADAVFLDIGANVGAYSFFAASCSGPHARIIAIEPQPKIHQRLQTNIAFNPGVPIEAIQLAIADIDGAISLFVDEQNAGETSMRRLAGNSGSATEISVSAKPLAALVSDLGLQRIDAMKIDIEGAEDIALAPFFEAAPATLWPSVLILENSPESWQIDCIDLARKRGYQLVLSTRLNVVLTRPATG